MLTDSLDDFVGFEGKPANETVFAACQESVIIQLKETVNAAGYALNPVAVRFDVVSLEYHNTAFTGGTDDIFSISHQFHSIEFLVKRFRYGI